MGVGDLELLANGVGPAADVTCVVIGLAQYLIHDHDARDGHIRQGRPACEYLRLMRELLIEKLRPDRFTAMSGRMAAIVGYILDERFSDPAISELVVTSDGFVLAQSEGRCERHAW